MTDTDDPVAEVWEELLADASATAADYREAGWETLELHPGDVTLLTGEYGDRVGIDLLIPDDEYRSLADWFEAGFAVDDYEVYRSTAADTVLLLVVVRDETDRRAVLYPAFYRASDERARELFATAGEAGEVHAYLRRLSGDFVEFAHDDPGLFVPDGDGTGSPADRGPAE